MLETNIDNMNSEIYGYLYEKLLNIGVLDIFVTPIYMKKNRAASMISVLVAVENEKKALDIIFNETTTLGIRKRMIQRYELERWIKDVKTEFGNIAVKFAKTPSGKIKYHPEYEEVKCVAERMAVSFQTVFNSCLKAAENYLNKDNILKE